MLDSTVNLVGEIKVCTINIGWLSQHKVNMVSWYLLRHKIDVCFLIDVRLTVMESSYQVKEFKQRLGKEIMWALLCTPSLKQRVVWVVSSLLSRRSESNIYSTNRVMNLD